MILILILLTSQINLERIKVISNGEHIGVASDWSYVLSNNNLILNNFVLDKIFKGNFD